MVNDDKNSKKHILASQNNTNGSVSSDIDEQDEINKKLEKELDSKITEIEYESLEDQAQETAKKYNLPYINLKQAPTQDRALTLIDEQIARNAEAVGIKKDDETFILAIHNPDKTETKTLIEKLKADGHKIHLVIVSMHSLLHTYKRYELNKEKEVIDPSTLTISESDINNVKKEIQGIQNLKEKILKLPVSEVLDIMVKGALELQASDIHLQPEQKIVRLRYRLDGILVEIMIFPITEYKKLLSRIKLHAGIKINIHNKPQDGRFHVKQGEKNIEVRVSALPGPEAESIVMRILDPLTIDKKLEELGMREDSLKIIKRALKKKTGAVFTTGPTGSGKTTTLYAFAQFINSPEIKLITLEDPIEYRIDGIVQTQVDRQAGYTFADGLRSIVRQDPDVILVGEIRDLETAEMALQAALTGHMVLSTVHTNNAAGTIPRLIDLGVKPATISPAINIIMAQRLIRKLCLNCKNKETIKKEDYILLEEYLTNLPETVSTINLSPNMQIFYPKKCELCNNTGYSGRIGVYEIIEVDGEIERIIIESPITTVIEKMAKSKGMVTLLQDGLLKVVNGITSVEEIMRVVGE